MVSTCKVPPVPLLPDPALAGDVPLPTDRQPTDRQLYHVMSFASRVAAVRFCLGVSDALATEDRRRPATLWLAATDAHDGAFLVYACDRALAAARGAGNTLPVSGRVALNAMPAARCLVVGDTAALLGD